MGDTRWGSFCGGATEAVSYFTLGATLPVHLGAASVAGAVSKANGGSFADGLEHFYESVEDHIKSAASVAEQFGDDNSEQLTKGAKFVGKSAVGGVISLLTGRAAGAMWPNQPPV